MKITHVKVCNYRNLRNIDIGLAETVAIIGENNSGKSNFLKAITLPFLTDDNTHVSKKLSWSDINNETKKCYYNKIIENQIRIAPTQYMWFHRRFKTRPAGEAKFY